MVLYRVVDSAGSLLILKSNSSKRNCNNGFDFSLEKLMLKSPAKTSGMLHKFLLFLLSVPDSSFFLLRYSLHLCAFVVLVLSSVFRTYTYLRF